jgi:hypothetical protein
MDSIMKKVLFIVAAALAVVGVIAAVYFLIPGIYHPYLSLQSGSLTLVNPVKHPAVVKSVHRVYAAGSFGLALIFVAIAFVLRPKKAQQVRAA